MSAVLLTTADERQQDFDVVVVGGGASGLAAAWELGRRDPALRVAVLESQARVGGTARSDQGAGYVVDCGPNGVLSNAPYVLDWARALGLGTALIQAHPSAKRRYVYVGGRLRALPFGLLHSAALGVDGVARALSEPWRRSSPSSADESVYAFIERRFGPAAAELLAGPMVAGVSAGDARETSLEALFPRVAAAERTHGSLLKGLRASGGPRPKLMSLKGGMGLLTSAAADALGDSVHTGVRVERVRPLEALMNGSAARQQKMRWELSWSADTESGPAEGTLRTRNVILATPSHITARLLAPVDAPLGQRLAEIPYVGIRVVTLGFERSDVPRSLDGFGYLVPRSEGLRTLGCVWASNVFPDRAPAGKVALRVMLGGAHDPEAVALPQDAALALARAELRQVMGISATPDFVHHARWPRSIPQYAQGHRERVRAIDTMVEAHAGLHLCGNAYHGVSLNETVRVAMEAGARAAESP